MTTALRTRRRQPEAIAFARPGDRESSGWEGASAVVRRGAVGWPMERVLRIASRLALGWDPELGGIWWRR
jgi:hypothetical protein